MIRALTALVELLAIALGCSMWKGTHPTIAILTIFGLGVVLLAVICFAAYLADRNVELAQMLADSQHREMAARAALKTEIDHRVDRRLA